MLSDRAGDHRSSSPHWAPRWAPHSIWSTLHEATKKEAMHALDQNEEDCARGRGGGRGSTTAIFQWADRGQRRGGGDGHVLKGWHGTGTSASVTTAVCGNGASGQPLGTGAHQSSDSHARGAAILDHAWVTVDSVRFL